MKEYRIAIVGATGMVGQTFIKVLLERKFPISKIVFFASKKSAGQLIMFKDISYEVQELTPNSFDEGFDIALFSAGGQVSLTYAPIAVSKNVRVIDNSSAFRMHEDIKLIVPEVNADILTSCDFLISNPNCSTIQSVVPLKVIDDLFKVTRVAYNTYQAVSGSGYMGVSDLERGTRGEAPVFYPKPIYQNCIPQIDVFLPTGYTKEEQKMIDETIKILDRTDIKVTATCVRVPVLNGHSVSMNVSCEREIDYQLLYQSLSAHEGIVFYPGETYPTAKDVEGDDLIHVGRIRSDLSLDNSLNLWVVADNIRKGAATNAIQIAEYLIKEEML